MQIVVAVESLGKHLGATISGNTGVRWHLQLFYPDYEVEMVFYCKKG